MPAIDIPTHCRPRSPPTARSSNSSSNGTWMSSATAASSPAPGTGSCTAAAAGRSVTWTGAGSTATGRHRPPRLPLKAPPASRPFYPAVSWNELNRARFICWLAPPSPKTSSHCGSTPGTPPLHTAPPPKKDRSPSPSVSSATTADAQPTACKASLNGYVRPRRTSRDPQRRIGCP